MRKRYRIGMALAIGLMLAAVGAVAYAHEMIGIHDASASPSVVGPGEPLTVDFQYDTKHWSHWAHAAITTVPWAYDGYRLLLDRPGGSPPGGGGTLLAEGKGPGTHPVDGSIKTYVVSENVTLPGALAPGIHTITIATDVNAGLDIDGIDIDDVWGPPPYWGCGASCHLGADLTLELELLIIEIDIKPWSDPNSINTKSKGVVPVAILGSDQFDVTTVDVTTLSFGPGGAAPAHDLTAPKTYAKHLEDANGDGTTDLVAHYPQKDTGLAPGDTKACVRGALTDGTPFRSCDSVRIVK